MFAIIGCNNCKRKRIIDTSNSVTTCPYCNHKTTTKTAKIYFKNDDQSVVRNVLTNMTISTVNEEEPTDPNPLSALACALKHITDIDAKINIIAEELTKIKGTFELKDVEEIAPGKGKRYLEMMLVSCIIHEVGYGKYRI
ncbi:MAG: hypothetical protein MJZ03_02505 [archaeon]|nr:hypothetical protein [archaeon]